jgi:hypothetical protein
VLLLAEAGIWILNVPKKITEESYDIRHQCDHVCNPSCLGGCNWEKPGLNAAQTNSFWDFISQITRVKWTGGVAQAAECFTNVKPWVETHQKKLSIYIYIYIHMTSQVSWRWVDKGTVGEERLWCSRRLKLGRACHALGPKAEGTGEEAVSVLGCQRRLSLLRGSQISVKAALSWRCFVKEVFGLICEGTTLSSCRFIEHITHMKAQRTLVRLFQSAPGSKAF